MRGTVRSFLPQKSFGFIHGEDGNDYFFHIADVAGAVQLAPLQSVQFDPTATPKGLKARSVQPGPMPQLIQVTPNQFIMTKLNYVRGYEIVRQVGTAWGKSNDPNVARDLLKQQAIGLGANAVINMGCDRYTEQKGCSNYRYTMHRFDGTAVVVARNEYAFDADISSSAKHGNYSRSHFSCDDADQEILVRPHALVFYPRLMLAWVKTIAFIVGLIPVVLFCRLFQMKPRFMEGIDTERPTFQE
jgi:cold shock CspA family protein/uncharacterized protein YbjQ (UPF0145 family)